MTLSVDQIKDSNKLLKEDCQEERRSDESPRNVVEDILVNYCISLFPLSDFWVNMVDEMLINVTSDCSFTQLIKSY